MTGLISRVLVPVICGISFFTPSVYALDWYWIAIKGTSNVETSTSINDINTATAHFKYLGGGGRKVVANSGCVDNEQKPDNYWESDFALVPRELTLTDVKSGQQYKVTTTPVSYSYLYSGDSNNWVFGNPIQQNNLQMICQPVGSTSPVTPGVGDLVMSFSFDITPIPPGEYSFTYIGGSAFAQWGSAVDINHIVKVAVPYMVSSGDKGNIIKEKIEIPNYCNGVADTIRHGNLSPGEIEGNQATAGVTVTCLKASSVTMRISGTREPNNGMSKADGVTSLGKGIDAKLTFVENGSNTIVDTFQSKRVMISSKLMRTGMVAEGYYKGGAILQIEYN
ncbi:MrpH family fimbial adhesin [Escherichia coli]|uniref:MrpH family fimbial adhesin n=1 Tax=Escherichia coli TaxID=562 RepID=UPI001C405B3A|nr:hypothetical protein [Escherichia coli]